MTNKELLDILIVSDIVKFDLSKVNKEVFECFLRDKEVWDLEETLKYSKNICKFFGIIDNKQYINKFIRSELMNGAPIFAKTIYNTLIFDDKDFIKSQKSLEASLRKILYNKITSEDEFHEIGTYLNFYWSEISKSYFENSITYEYAYHIDSVYLINFKENRLLECNGTVNIYNNNLQRMEKTNIRVSKFKRFDSIDWSKTLGINIQDFDIMF